MSKRPHDSQAPASASEDLVERLKAAGNDAVLLREIIEGNDSASVAVAFAALLTSPSTEAINDVKRRKKTRNQLSRSTPNETLVDILLFADRDALDAMQLVCRFLLEFIQDREADELPLRSISRVLIGKRSRPKYDDDWEEHWLPFVGVIRDSSNNKKGFKLPTVNRLVPYLRLAYCESICVDLRFTHCVRYDLCPTAYGAILNDLDVPSTFVGLLTVCVDDGSATRCVDFFEKFEPSKAVVKVDGHHNWASAYDEAFFIDAAECGVRSIKFASGRHTRTVINLLPALSFGFAEPATGGDRNISGVDCVDGEDNFLAQVVKKASELDGRERIDFKFSIDDLLGPVDPTGFEKYQKGEGIWVVDDLENGIKVKVVEAERSTEIHVFSSV